MITCSKCNRPNPDGSVSCNYCGLALVLPISPIAPPRKSPWVWVFMGIFGCLGALLLTFGLLLYPVFAKARDQAIAQNEVHRAFQVNVAMLAYITGNNDTFPEMSHASEALDLYIHDPEAISRMKGYDWNPDLSGMPYKKIKNIDQIWEFRSKEPDASGKYVLSTWNSTRRVPRAILATFEHKPILLSTERPPIVPGSARL